MDRSNPEAIAIAVGPQKRTLLLAALVPFGVVGLLASPIAFNAFRHLVGF